MKLLIILIGIACLISTAIYLVHRKAPSASSEMEVAEAFISWKTQYGINYSDPKVESLKYSIFKENYLQIKSHKSKNYELGVNQFMTLTPEEFEATHLTMFPLQNIAEEYVFERIDAPPSAVDWRTQKAVSPIKDQGQCGSCWAFSTTGALETCNFLFGSKNMTLYSEQQLVDCSKDNQGCDGGNMPLAFEYVVKNGIDTEEDYPYKAVGGTCQNFTVAYNISGYKKITSLLTDTNLKQAIAQQTVSVGVDARNWQFYNSGIFDNCGKELDHGVLAVGYTKDYWIVKNSWAEGWGEQGYIRIKMGNTCGIRNLCTIPTQ